MTSSGDDTGAPTPGERECERSGDAGEPSDRRDERPGAIPDPEPEEAPELLGERSDYPIAWDGDES